MEPGRCCDWNPKARMSVKVVPGHLRPRGDDWLATGMGFWVARYAVQEHGGELVESEGVRAVRILPRDEA